jgi:hypothetical protein
MTWRKRAMIEAWYDVDGRRLSTLLCRRCESVRRREGEQFTRATNASAYSRARERSARCHDCGRTRAMITADHRE